MATSLAVALEQALNEDPFTGTTVTEPSGSSYIVTATGDDISIRLGEEVIDNLDQFVVLPEKTISRAAFVPGWVADGGRS